MTAAARRVATLVPLRAVEDTDRTWARSVALPALLAAVDGLEVLPLLPATARHVACLARASDLSLPRVLALASRDPLLAAALLRAAGEVAGPPVATLRDAVVRLGARRLRLVLAGLAATPLRDAPPDLAARVQLRADAVAVAASQIARLRGEDADVAFTAGLLHDLGHAAVHAACATPDADLPGDLRDARRAAVAARHVHEEVGLHLATRWGLATPLAAAIGHHHAPAAAGPDAWAPRVVAAALHVADRLGIAPVEPPHGRLEDDPVLARLHLDAGRVSDLCRTVASEVVLLAA